MEDENTGKFHYVLPGQTHQNRWRAGEIVELLPGQAAGWIGATISEGYATEAAAKKASAPKASAKEVENVKQ